MSKPPASSSTANDLEDPTATTAVVLEQDTIVPQVLWQRQHRSYTDKWFGLVYLLSYLAFIGCGITLAVKSQARYELDTDTQLRYVSPFFENDVESCCNALSTNDNTFNFTAQNLCLQLRSSNPANRFLATAGTSTFTGDEGIFDAFLEAPEIIAGIIGLAVVVAFLWVVLLRFFAKPIVILTEVAKIGLFIYFGIVQQQTSTRFLCFFIALGILLYDIWARKQILFAGDIISHSVLAFKENPVMFVALLLIQVLFVGNALLFVFFFSQAFDVAHVEEQVDCFQVSFDGSQICQSQCVFAYPDWVGRIMVYMSLSYLWTLFLFHKMRLSVIATIVGSWHFEQEDKPSILTAMLNTATTSFGTLSVSSLIATVAEKINRIANEPWYKSWLGPGFFVTAPLSLLMCIFGSCISLVLKMLTKFAVIVHVWTGLPFVGSAKKVFKIMSRHFKGGFVTEVTSQGVLKLGSYAFSIGITLLTWVWLDDKFNTDSLPGGADASYVVAFFLAVLFTLWYPVLGLYLIIVVSSFLSKIEHTQHLWLPGLASMFVGCLSMMFFMYISAIFLDTIDVLFLCFCVDQDNGIDRDNAQLKVLVSSLPNYMGEKSVVKKEETVAVAQGDAIVAVAM